MSAQAVDKFNEIIEKETNKKKQGDERKQTSLLAPAEKIANTNSQSQINQSKHTQILSTSADDTGANPKRVVSSVKHVQNLFLTAERRTDCSKNIRDAKFCVLQFSGRAAM